MHKWSVYNVLIGWITDGYNIIISTVLLLQVCLYIPPLHHWLMTSYLQKYITLITLFIINSRGVARTFSQGWPGKSQWFHFPPTDYDTPAEKKTNNNKKNKQTVISLL